MTSKPVTAWAVKKQVIYLHTIHEREEDCIDDFQEEHEEDWDNLKKRGYRCVKVRIEEVSDD